MTSHTTFILGAGASQPYGMPLGPDLITKIINFSKQRYPDLGSKLDTICPPSIDSFLARYDENSETVKSAKDAIANIILLSQNNDQAIYSNSHHWMGLLFWELLEYLKTVDYEPADLPIRIITFNYDLTVELFFEKIMHSADFIPSEKREKIKRLFGKCILHVYGQVGVFDWQSNLYKKLHPEIEVKADHIFTSNDNYKTKFKLSPNNAFFELSEIPAGLIKLMRSGHADPVKNKIRKWISDSQIVLFMGYGFHDDNNQLFFDTDRDQGTFENVRLVAATAKGCNTKALHKIHTCLSERTSSTKATVRGSSTNHNGAVTLGLGFNTTPVNLGSDPNIRISRIVDADCSEFLTNEIYLSEYLKA